MVTTKHSTKNRIRLGAALVCGIFLSQVSIANAGILTFTDRAAWRAAAGCGVGDLTQDFNSFAGTHIYGNPAGVTAGFLNFATVSGNFGGDSSWSIRDSANLAGSKTVNGTSYVSLVSYNPPSGDTLITHQDLSALGFDYAGKSNTPSNDANLLTLLTSLGDNLTDPTILGSSSGFFGFVYDAGETFTSIQVRDLNDNRTFFGADNFEAFSSVSNEIPEPASLVLFGLGLAGLGYARRKSAA